MHMVFSGTDGQNTVKCRSSSVPHQGFFDRQHYKCTLTMASLMAGTINVPSPWFCTSDHPLIISPIHPFYVSLVQNQWGLFQNKFVHFRLLGVVFTSSNTQRQNVLRWLVVVLLQGQAAGTIKITFFLIRSEKKRKKENPLFK